MELDDGRVMTQSNAIALYCASEAGLLPTDPVDLARTMELQFALEEVCRPLAHMPVNIECMRLQRTVIPERHLVWRGTVSMD